MRYPVTSDACAAAAVDVDVAIAIFAQLAFCGATSGFPTGVVITECGPVLSLWDTCLGLTGMIAKRL
jgi:hypothetical protein